MDMGIVGEGSQGGSLPIYDSGNLQSGWSDTSYNVNSAASLSAHLRCYCNKVAHTVPEMLHCCETASAATCSPVGPARPTTFSLLHAVFASLCQNFH